MRKLMQYFLDKLTEGKTFSESEDDLLLYTTLSVIVLFAGVMHIFLLLATLALGVTLFIFLNIVSITVYAVLFLLVTRRRMYRFAGVAMTIEVTLYALFASIYMGVDCFFFLYFFLLMLLQVNIPYASRRVRTVSSMGIFLATLVSVIIGHFVPPLYEFKGQNGLFGLSVFNCSLCFLGMLIEILALNIIRMSNAERVRKFEKRAHTDSLTGIFNRWYADGFISTFREEQAGRKWCVAIMDVDDFKQINDTLGHPVGDEVLRALAGILSSSFRKTDVLFRWGGEEFLVFLSDVELKTAEGILEAVRRRIVESPVSAANTSIEYTVTIGVAEVDPNNVIGSITLCDERLYHGKQNGKNRVVAAI